MDAIISLSSKKKKNYIYIYIYLQRSTHLRRKLKGRKFENKCCIIASITENQAFLFNFFNAIITPE